jgi:hypothetical protein
VGAERPRDRQGGQDDHVCRIAREAGGFVIVDLLASRRTHQLVQLTGSPEQRNAQHSPLTFHGRRPNLSAMLINLKNGKVIHTLDKRYIFPARPEQKVCGRYAPQWPYYRCTREAGHGSVDPKLPHTHAAHGAYRGGMFAVWMDEDGERESKP